MLQKRLALLCAICLLAGSLAGCDKREGASLSEASQESSENGGESANESESSGSESSSAPETRPTNLTDEEAAAHNAEITDEDFSLVQFTPLGSEDPMAIIKVAGAVEGTIRVRLFPDQAPKTVENFIQLAEKGYYNGITFHQVLWDYVVQAGDPTGTGAGGESIYSQKAGDPGYFEDEFSLDLWNFRGALSMANAGRQHSNSSQFLIVQREYVGDEEFEKMRKINFPESVIEKYEEVGGAPNLDSRNTVFGMVIGDGMAVVDEIASVKTDEQDVPEESVIIESITIQQ